LLSHTFVFADSGISISYNGSKINYDGAYPEVEDGEIMIPLKATVTALGGSYQELIGPGQKGMIFYVKEKALTVFIGSKSYAVSDIPGPNALFVKLTSYDLEKEILEKNNDIYFPLKTFCEALGFGVKQVENTIELLEANAQEDEADNGEIKVILNGEKLAFDVPPIIEGGRTLVPMRKIFEAFGSTVDWEDSSKTITASLGDIVIIMQIGNPEIIVNDKKVTLDVPPMIYNDRTLVPVRAVAESFNCQVDWVESTRSVIITKEENKAEIKAENNVTTNKKARNPQNGLLYGYSDDRIAEIQFEARYLFEQKILPEILYQIYGNKIIEYLKTNNIDMMKATILSIWEYATLNVIVHDAVLNGEITDISDENKLMEFALNRRPMYPLGDEHIEDVSIEKLDNGTPVAIVKLKDTNWTAISTYIGITYENDKLRIFTLEKSAGFTEEPIYMFCFVSDTSRGFITSIPNSKEEFIKAINMQING